MAPSNSPKVKALILTFEHHDVKGLSEEINAVEYAFRSLWGLDTQVVTNIQIPKKDSLKVLEAKLDALLPRWSRSDRNSSDTLFIIYYRGRGHKNEKHQLSLLRSYIPSFVNECMELLVDEAFTLTPSKNSHNQPRNWEDKLTTFWKEIHQHHEMSADNMRNRL